MIIIIMRGDNFVVHLDGLGGTPVCRGTLVAHHCVKGRTQRVLENRVLRIFGPKKDEETGEILGRKTNIDTCNW
jgi:hypothetical protein